MNLCEVSINVQSFNQSNKRAASVYLYPDREQFPTDLGRHAAFFFFKGFFLMAKLAGVYEGQNFLGLELDGSKPIIEGLLWERDSTILLAKEKTGKSVFGQHLSMSATCAEPFLGEFDIPEELNVIYLQAEGKLSQTQSNLKNICKVIPANLNRFLLLYFPAIALDTQTGMDSVQMAIDAWKPPEAKNTLFIGDSLYMMAEGDLTNSNDAKKIVGNLRHLQDKNNLTMLIMTHAHRAQKNQQGDIIDEGDDSIFGSFVWKAYPDSIILLKKYREKHIKMSCSTHRAGKVIEELDLSLIEPDPLYFELKGDSRASDEAVYHCLLPQTFITSKEIEHKTGYKKSAIWASLNRLYVTNRLEKTNENHRPIGYRLITSTELEVHV